MSSASMVTREDLALAAARVSGLDTPLPANTPKAARVYLYALPAEDGSAFPVETLAGRLSESGLAVGMDWDRESETYGVRFVLKADRLPTEIAPFAGQDARKEWAAWKLRQRLMAQKVSEAATAMAKGEPVDFDRDNEMAPMPSGSRGRTRRELTERD